MVSLINITKKWETRFKASHVGDILYDIFFFGNTFAVYRKAAMVMNALFFGLFVLRFFFGQ